MDHIITPDESIALLDIISLMKTEYDDAWIREDSGNNDVGSPPAREPGASTERPGEQVAHRAALEALATENASLKVQLQDLRRGFDEEKAELSHQIEKLQAEADSVKTKVAELRTFFGEKCTSIAMLVDSGKLHCNLENPGRVCSRDVVKDITTGITDSSVAVRDSVLDYGKASAGICRAQAVRRSPNLTGLNLLTNPPSTNNARLPRERILEPQPASDLLDINSLMAENAELKRRAREAHRMAVSEKAKLSLEICLLENRERVNEAQHLLERERLLTRESELQEVVDGCLHEKRIKDARSKKAAQKALDSRRNHENTVFELKTTIANLKRAHATERKELLNELQSLHARRNQDEGPTACKPLSIPPSKRIRRESTNGSALYFNNPHLVVSAVTGVQPRSAHDGTYHEPVPNGACENSWTEN